MEDHIKFQSLPPLKRFRHFQLPNLHDDKENNPTFNSSFRLPAKKRKESRPHPLPQSTLSSDFTTFSLPAKKRVSALHPNFFLANPLPPFDLNVEYKPPSSLDQGNGSPYPVVAKVFEEIPQLVNEDEGNKSPPASAYNLFEEMPQLEEVRSDESPNSIVLNLFVEIPQPVSEDNGSATSMAAPEDEQQDGEDTDDGIVCAICQSTDGDPTDPIVFCDGCDLMVHTTCYGNPLINCVPDGDWFCAQCLVSRTQKTKNKDAFPCCLCPTKTGAMKPTKDGLWAHVVCAVFVPEVFFEDPDGREGINCCEVPKWRWQDKCYICKTREGCAIRCSEPKCPLAFHVTCGLNQDLCIEYKQGRKNEEIIVAGFCKNHTELWKKQQQTGKFKIVASKENSK